MAVPIIGGQRATAASQGIQSESRIVDMAKRIFLLEPSAAPLTLLSSMASKAVVINPEFKALEDEAVPALDTVDGTITAAITDLVVDNPEYWHPNSLLVVQETLETLLVTAVNVGTSTLTVERSWGAVPAATITDGDTLMSLGGAAEEGALAEASKTTIKQVITNFTQIFRWPFALTETTMASDLYGGKDLPWQQKKGGIDQLTRIERAFLFGEQNEDLTGTEPRRSTGGMFPFITTNSDDLAGPFDMLTFYAIASDAFRYGRKDKVFFTSRILTSSIAADATAQLDLMPKDKTFGMDITMLLTPHGRLRVINHDLLEGPVFGGYGLIVDLDSVGVRHMPGRDNKLKTNIQAPDADARKDEYIAEMGLFRVEERKHAEVTGVT